MGSWPGYITALLPVQQPPAHGLQHLAVALDGFLDRAAQGGQRHASVRGPGEIGAGLGLGQHGGHDRGQGRMLGVVQMVGLGRGEQDPLDPLATQKAGQPAVAARAKGAQHIGHGAAQILDRARPLMDGAQHIDQHDLPVDLGEMVAEEGLHDLGLVALIAPRHLAPEAAAPGFGRLRQRGKGQDRRPGQIARQQEPPRRAVGPALPPAPPSDRR